MNHIWTDIVEHEASGTVSALRHSGLETFVADQGCLLIAKTAGDGHAVDWAARQVHQPVNFCRRFDRGQRVHLDPEKVAKFLVPLKGLKIKINVFSCMTSRKFDLSTHEIKCFTTLLYTV